jgi:long-subunit fatty acid transport protein
VQFNFGNPGARSLGMGGAFIGRADDASAAEANPAGLTVIARPEVTLEWRHIDFRERVSSGVQGLSSNVQTVHSSVTTPSVLFAFPVRNLAFAGYFTRPLDYRQQISLSQPTGSFVPVTGIGNLFFGDSAGDFSLHYRDEVYGLSGAWKLGGLSLGAGARYQRFAANASFADFDTAIGPAGVPIKSSTTPTSFGRIEGKDSKLTYSAGLLWANESQNLSFGLVYKSGADYSVTECNPSTASEGCSSKDSFPAPSSFEIPTQIGAGVSVRPMPRVTINADVVRVQYSHLLRNFTPGAFCVAGTCDQSAESLGFHIANATEVHLGGEWLRPGGQPFALRAGWWHDPSHSVEYNGPTNSPAPLVKLAELFSAQSFPVERAQNHVAVGVGYLGSTFSINAAYDRSSLSRTASISAKASF